MHFSALFLQNRVVSNLRFVTLFVQFCVFYKIIDIHEIVKIGDVKNGHYW